MSSRPVFLHIERLVLESSDDLRESKTNVRVQDWKTSEVRSGDEDGGREVHEDRKIGRDTVAGHWRVLRKGENDDQRVSREFDASKRK